jgi:transcription-repair coupling factor (superfamily II helicase)
MSVELVIPLDPEMPGRLTLGGVPQGQDARALVRLAAIAGPGGHLHVALDDTRLAQLVDMLAFFAPMLDVVHLPAWDCLPYDRVSPRAEIVGQRIEALTHLVTTPKGERLVLTTINALLQRVPPRTLFNQASFSAKAGERVNLEALRQFLLNNGYNRAETVREPGEYAIRGGIFDLFPPGNDEPLRLDFFDDELEQVRRFDPGTQRTTLKVDGFTLKPVAELLLDDASIARFRTGYRELFGAVNDDDPLYEAVSAGRKYGGMEHWLPLFHERLDTLLDYLPRATVSLDFQAHESRTARLAQIEDFYQSRKAMLAAAAKGTGASYKPLPPDRLYLTDGELTERLSRRPVAEFTPFAVDATTGRGADLGGRRGRDFAEARNKARAQGETPEQAQDNVFDAVATHLEALARSGKRVLLAAYSLGSRDRLGGLLRDHGVEAQAEVTDWLHDIPKPGIVGLCVLPLEQGFEASDLALITEQDILGDRLARPRQRRRKSENFIAEISSLQPGDFVVHVDHGIGKFDGLETVMAAGAPHDCLRVLYADGDKLFLPVENLEVLTRYGSEIADAVLDKLGGSAWQARKAKVKQRIRDMAAELLKVAAERALRHAEVVVPPEGMYDEFCARFPYAETDDQLKAIEDVLADLSSGRPMDRLVCGDVGFGKTEVALRAAFVAAMSGKQVAVVVPTTLLSRQHFKNFERRFTGLPLRVAQLSRMVTTKDAKLIKQEMELGTMDIVIGTHALLAKDVKFKDLGLLIVDEEQHFGVRQKERLKQLRADVNVLTLTATPIPRTLQMALSGVRELSLIATPPVDRLAVRTFVLPYDAVVIREALLREHYRGGQSFYVCPRLEDLPKLQERLAVLVPELKVISAHGRLAPTQLEEVMTAFYDGKYDILLATNIIESGLDIPNANTLVVHRAEMFGLAQLYQIRGRVGRSKTRGYAYLTYQAGKTLSGTAQQRMHVIETLDSLGAGFQLASYDMDIRGAGNLLGEEQSGQVREVGIELYQQMLRDAVDEARAGLKAEEELARDGEWTPQIQLGMPVLIPETYVSALNIRMDLYRRLSALVDADEIEGFAAEMIDRFGKIPVEVENLLAVIAIKADCRKAGIERLDGGPKGAVITFRNNRFRNVAGLMQFVEAQAGALKMRPDQKLVYVRAWEDAERRVKGARKLARDLAIIANATGTLTIQSNAPPPPPPAPKSTKLPGKAPVKAMQAPKFTPKPVQVTRASLPKRGWPKR